MKLLLIFLILIPISFVVRAICVSQMWLWFIVPLGVPEISVAHSFGILSLIFLLMAGVSKDKTEIENETDVVMEILASVSVYLFATVIAGIIRIIFMV